MREKFDRGSKWLIQHHGDSILRLGGVTGVLTWKPVSAELVQPKQLPDGLVGERRRRACSVDSVDAVQRTTGGNARGVPPQN